MNPVVQEIEKIQKISKLTGVIFLLSAFRIPKGYRARYRQPDQFVIITTSAEEGDSNRSVTLLRLLLPQYKC